MYLKHIFAIVTSVVFISCAEQVKLNEPGGLWLDNNGTFINAHGAGVLYDRNDGVYYLYGEHKTEGTAGNNANVGVHCYSSSNLYDWKDEGIALSVDTLGSGSPIEAGCILERPKVIYCEKTGKYVMWFHLEPKGAGYTGAFSGVAVSDTPTGPFSFIEAVHPNAGVWPLDYPDDMKTTVNCAAPRYEGSFLPAHPDSLNILGRDFTEGQMARDMTLFVDEDGKAYHIFSSEDNSTLHIAQLADDYLSHNGVWVRAFVNRFMEAPAIFKKDGKYYMMMSGCTGWDPNAARSAVADNILGPWTELGNPCRGEGSELTYGSQSTYILKIEGKNDYLYMGDIWNPENAIDGRYIWLPISFEEDKFTIDLKRTGF